MCNVTSLATPMTRQRSMSAQHSSTMVKCHSCIGCSIPPTSAPARKRVDIKWYVYSILLCPPNAHTLTGSPQDLPKPDDHRYNAPILWKARNKGLHSNGLSSWREPDWSTHPCLHRRRDPSPKPTCSCSDMCFLRLNAGCPCTP